MVVEGDVLWSMVIRSIYGSNCGPGNVNSIKEVCCGGFEVIY